MPQAHALLARWRAGMSRLAASDGGPRVLGTGDSVSPFNAGLWTIARPSRGLYEAGLQQMRVAAFNESHGFGLLGTPRALASARPELRKQLNWLTRTHLWRHDAWGSAVFGDCDQGFLLYMFYLYDGGVGARMAPAQNAWRETAACRLGRDGESYAGAPDTDCAHTARHHYGMIKPWELLNSGQNQGRVAQYLSTIDFANFTATSACAAAFAAWAPRLPPAAPRGTHLRHHGKYQRVGP